MSVFGFVVAVCGLRICDFLLAFVVRGFWAIVVCYAGLCCLFGWGFGIADLGLLGLVVWLACMAAR